MIKHLLTLCSFLAVATLLAAGCAGSAISSLNDQTEATPAGSDDAAAATGGADESGTDPSATVAPSSTTATLETDPSSTDSDGSQSSTDEDDASPTPTTSTAESDQSAADDEAATDPTASTIDTSSWACVPRRLGTSAFSLKVENTDYQVRIVIPDNYRGEVMPVVLDWHGLGSNGFQQAQYTGYEGLAEQAGFIAVHPSGPRDATFGNTGWALDGIDVEGRDDLAMVGDLIDTLIADYCADPERVYSTGMSNGGFFTARLVCHYADRIAAAVSVGGLSHPDDCDPSRAVPYMAFHGTADKTVPYDGGKSDLVGPDTPPVIAELLDQVIPDEFAEFAADFGCNPEPTIKKISDEVTSATYSGCEDGVPLVLNTIEGGGHTWPGSPFGIFLTDQLGMTTYDVSATSGGWAFMSNYSLDN